MASEPAFPFKERTLVCCIEILSIKATEDDVLKIPGPILNQHIPNIFPNIPLIPSGFSKSAFLRVCMHNIFILGGKRTDIMYSLTGVIYWNLV